MFQPKISVIIPVYNTGEYLEETLMSVLQQTMINDIEVLMIDDGSTDDSKYIIEKYALDFDNFHAFHKENKGQGVARNYGINIAKGEYVHFMDPDDYLDLRCMETLYNTIERNSYDCVSMNFYMCDSHKKVLKSYEVNESFFAGDLERIRYIEKYILSI